MEFYEFATIICCTMFPLFWFFFVYEARHGPLGTSDIPGEFGYLFFGEALEFFQDPLDFTYSRFSKHGEIFKSKLLGHSVVFVGGDRGLELFTAGPEQGLGASPDAYLFDLPLYSFNGTSRKRSVLLSESDCQHGFKHLAVLSAITTMSNSPDFFDDCVSVIEMTMDAQTSLADPFSGSKLCKDLFLHISISIFMKDMIQKNKLKDLLERWFAMHSAYPLSYGGLHQVWESGRSATAELDALLCDEVRSRLGPDREFGNDLIGGMLDVAMRRSDGFGKTLNDIIEKTVLTECWTVLHSVCVHTAGACTWLLASFEKYPHVKEAAITEVRNCSNCQKFEVIHARGTFPILEAIIEESLRMYGFLGHPLLRRVALFDIRFNEQFTIPKGTPVLLPLHTFNFQNTLFEDANLFKLERYVTVSASEKSRAECNSTDSDNRDGRRNFSFGVGHHSCPGDNMSRYMLKVVAVTLLNQFDTVSNCVQSFKPIYPRGRLGKTSHLSLELTSDQFYFPVPEDLLRYESLTRRHSAMSH